MRSPKSSAEAGPLKPFRYAEHRPPAAAAPFVHACWTFDVLLPPGETIVHHVWPDGCVSLAIVVQGGRAIACTVSGPDVTARRVPVLGGDRYRGIRLWPDAGPSLGIDAAALRGRAEPAPGRLGAAVEAFAHDVAAAGDDDAAFVAACERWLAPRVAVAAPLDPIVRAAVDRLIATDGAASVVDVAAACAIGVRQLERRFQRRVGLAPKAFARIRRVRATILATLATDDVAWSRLAAELGYADQAHLAREFRAVTGFPPTELRARLAAIEHRDVRA